VTQNAGLRGHHMIGISLPRYFVFIVDRSEFKCVLKSARPPLPKIVKSAEERPKRNFIKQNVDKAVKMATKQPASIVVVNCRGDRQDMSECCINEYNYILVIGIGSQAIAVII